MKHLMNFMVMLSLCAPVTRAWAKAGESPREDEIFAHFVALGGAIEDLDGREIDPSRTDIRGQTAFIVRPADSSRRVLIEQVDGSLRATVLGSHGPIQLASLDENLRKLDPRDGMIGIGTGMLTAACFAGLGTCPWVGAIVLAYVAIIEYERYHPVPAKP